MKNNNNLKSNRGFTLIELLVVVLIIGILTTVAVPKYTMIIEQAKAQEAVINLSAIFDAQERLYNTTGKYTDNLDTLDIDIRDTPNFIYRCWESRTCDAQPIKHKSYFLEFHSNYGATTAQQKAWQGAKWCIAQDARGDQICQKALGGRLATDSGGWGRYYDILWGKATN